MRSNGNGIQFWRVAAAVPLLVGLFGSASQAQVTATLTATPNSVPATGGDIDFTLTICNDGMGPILVLGGTSALGDLADLCGPVDPIDAGSCFTCTFTANVSGDLAATGVIEFEIGYETPEGSTVTLFTSVTITVDNNQEPDPIQSPECWKRDADMWFDLLDLRIGDFNLNGVEDPDELVIQLSVEDAFELLCTSKKSDKRRVLARQLVAAWLNYEVGGSSLDDIRGTIEVAIEWLLTQTPNGNPLLAGGANSRCQKWPAALHDWIELINVFNYSGTVCTDASCACGDNGGKKTTYRNKRFSGKKRFSSKW